jgi:FkbM family methyltransferase
MSWKRRLIEAADRPGGRTLLGLLATAYARAKTSRDVSLFHDGGGWLHRTDSDYVPLTHLYAYAARHDWHLRVASMIADSEDYWFHLYKPRKGDVIVDIGAGDGSDLPAFSRAVGSTGRVIAVEAHPRTGLLLERMCRWNKLDNVTFHQRAIMDRRGSVFIDDQEEHVFNAVSLTQREGQKHAVPALSLDDLCRQEGLTHIDFLKMNIEGAERQAIAGAAETIKRVTHLCIACHDFLAGNDDSLRTRASVSAFLRENGFRIVVRSEDPREYVRDHLHGVRE